jgi:transcription elongation factor Elf1
MFGKLICRFKGHKRGRRVVQEGDTSEMPLRFACPRCGAQWTRKAKVKAP